MTSRDAALNRFKFKLRGLSHTSKSKISELTKLAELNKTYANDIADVIERHIRRVSEKLPVLYLIDSLIKNLRDNYGPQQFSQYIVSQFISAYKKGDASTKSSMFELRQSWNRTFSNDILYAMDYGVRNINSDYPITASPPRDTRPAQIEDKLEDDEAVSSTRSENKEIELTSACNTSIEGMDVEVTEANWLTNICNELAVNLNQQMALVETENCGLRNLRLFPRSSPCLNDNNNLHVDRSLESCSRETTEALDGIVDDLQQGDENSAEERLEFPDVDDYDYDDGIDDDDDDDASSVSTILCLNNPRISNISGDPILALPPPQHEHQPINVPLGDDDSTVDVGDCRQNPADQNTLTNEVPQINCPDHNPSGGDPSTSNAFGFDFTKESQHFVNNTSVNIFQTSDVMADGRGDGGLSVPQPENCGMESTASKKEVKQEFFPSGYENQECSHINPVRFKLLAQCIDQKNVLRIAETSNTGNNNAIQIKKEPTTESPPGSRISEYRQNSVVGSTPDFIDLCDSDDSSVVDLCESDEDDPAPPSDQPEGSRNIWEPEEFPSDGRVRDWIKEIVNIHRIEIRMLDSSGQAKIVSYEKFDERFDCLRDLHDKRLGSDSVRHHCVLFVMPESEDHQAPLENLINCVVDYFKQTRGIGGYSKHILLFPADVYKFIEGQFQTDFLENIFAHATFKWILHPSEEDFCLLYVDGAIKRPLDNLTLGNIDTFFSKSNKKARCVSMMSCKTASVTDGGTMQTCDPVSSEDEDSSDSHQMHPRVESTSKQCGGSALSSDDELPELPSMFEAIDQMKRKLVSESGEHSVAGTSKRLKKNDCNKAASSKDVFEFTDDDNIMNASGKNADLEKKVGKGSKGSKKVGKISSKRSNKIGDKRSMMRRNKRTERNKQTIKWQTLHHHGPLFPPPYERLPDDVKLLYDGTPVDLSVEAEEVAGLYAKMLDHACTARAGFNRNFFNDWKKVMNRDEQNLIRDLEKCDFGKIRNYFKTRSDRTDNSKEGRKKNDKVKANKEKKYETCRIDGVEQRVKNAHIEPPSLFVGRRDHPREGRLKRRIRPEDVIINCSKDAVVPEAPPGHRWKEVRHNNKVSWLASWPDDVRNKARYLGLHETSNIKCGNDRLKFETARKLHKCIDDIRTSYTKDWESEDVSKQQQGVALYFIDKLSFPTGQDKDKTRETVYIGCCSLRVEHLKLYQSNHVIKFEYPGNLGEMCHKKARVDERVFTIVQRIMASKKHGDHLFDKISTCSINKHLRSFVPDMSTTTFKTYNMSHKYQLQLDKYPTSSDQAPLEYYKKTIGRIILCCKHKREPAQDRNEEHARRKIPAAVKHPSYLDPRITVAWCKKWDVPLDRCMTRVQKKQYAWAIELDDELYRFV